jgi:hypothetical protein
MIELGRHDAARKADELAQLFEVAPANAEA